MHWWETNKEGLCGWDKIKEFMRTRFQPTGYLEPPNIYKGRTRLLL